MEVGAGGVSAVAGAADGLSGPDGVALMGDKLGEVAVAGFVSVGVLQDHGVAAAVGVVVVGMCDFAGPWCLDRGTYFGSYVDAVVERGGTGDRSVALAEMGCDGSCDGRDGSSGDAPEGLDDEHQQDGEDGEGQGCRSEGAEDVFCVMGQHGSWSSSPSSAPAGSPTDTDMLPCLMVMALRLRTTNGSCANTAKPNNSPTPVSTDPSITPIGGTKKPPIINPIDTPRHTAKVTVCHCIFLFILIAIFDLKI